MPQKRYSKGSKQDHLSRSNSKTNKAKLHEIKLDLDDDYGEFESREEDSIDIERNLNANERVTIWMNTWMDDDDGDFEDMLQLNKVDK